MKIELFDKVRTGTRYNGTPIIGYVTFIDNDYENPDEYSYEVTGYNGACDDFADAEIELVAKANVTYTPVEEMFLPKEYINECKISLGRTNFDNQMCGKFPVDNIPYAQQYHKEVTDAIDHSLANMSVGSNLVDLRSNEGRDWFNSVRGKKIRYKKNCQKFSVSRRFVHSAIEPELSRAGLL